MKGYIIGGIIGLIVGIILMGLIMFNTLPKMMLLEDECKYNFSEAGEQLEESILKHDWAIPKVHDLQASMRKYGKNVRPIKVFEICKPDHAEKILNQSDERVASALMPCRVAIYEKEDGNVYVSRMNSALLSKSMGGIIEAVMAQAAKENETILSEIIVK